MQKTKERPAAKTAVRPDSFATLLVHAEPGHASTHRVEAAANLALDLDALLIGVGAETFVPAAVDAPFLGYASGQWVTLVQEEIGKNLAAAQAAFRRDAAGPRLEWRIIEDYPHHALTQLARAADVIVVGPRGAGGKERTADPADVVMAAGRPVLVVPEGSRRLRGEAVVVAWKDSRECRRAVADALPLLRRANDVIVQAVVRSDAARSAAFEIDDVVAGLKRRGVAARPLVTVDPPSGVTAEIERIAGQNGADLIVCGGYAHSRMREWALGGVTDDLIHRPACFVLMSH